MPTMKPLRCSRGFTLALLVAVLLACGIRQDEFDCENAAAHLQECCPGFDATSIECTYSPYCTTTYPAIDVADSDCIRSESCEALIGSGVCGRAGTLAGTASTATSAASPICGPNAPPFVPSVEAGGPPPPPGPPGISIACTGSGDCARGEVCCGNLGSLGGSSASTACAFAPCASGLQLCLTASECAPGRTCAAPVGGVSLIICAPETDASSDAGGGEDGAEGGVAGDGADGP